MLQATIGVDGFTSSVTILHIVWFAVLRFISLQWPIQFKAFNKKYVKVGSSNSKQIIDSYPLRRKNVIR